MNAQTGVCTPAGGLVTGEHPPTAPPGDAWPRAGAGAAGTALTGAPAPAGVLVLLSLGCLTSLFPYVPKAALAAVIIVAVAPLCDTKIVRTLWRVKSTCPLARQHGATAVPAASPEPQTGRVALGAATGARARAAVRTGPPPLAEPASRALGGSRPHPRPSPPCSPCGGGGASRWPAGASAAGVVARGPRGQQPPRRSSLCSPPRGVPGCVRPATLRVSSGSAAPPRVRPVPGLFPSHAARLRTARRCCCASVNRGPGREGARVTWGGHG